MSHERGCGRLLGCRCFVRAEGCLLVWTGSGVLCSGLVEYRTRILLGMCTCLTNLGELMSQKDQHLDIEGHGYEYLIMC